MEKDDERKGSAAMKITTTYDPWSPYRDIDWCAYDADTAPNGPRGWASTRALAIRDLAGAYYDEPEYTELMRLADEAENEAGDD